MLRGTFKATIATAAVALVAAAPAGAQEQGDQNRADQSGQTPRQFCKQYATPRTPDFRECVLKAARGLQKAENGDHSGGDRSARAEGAPGRFCRSNAEETGAYPGSDAFDDCVRKAAQARRAARD